MKLYGIKNCDSVKKARKFLDSHGIEYEFIDLKESKIDCNTIKKWLQFTTIDKLFNTRGKKYKELELKNLNLDEEEKKEWLCKEPILIKRPVIEIQNQTVVGYNIKEYENIFLQ